jgi:steroid delta-isomerase-like uncharacterized protein
MCPVGEKRPGRRWVSYILGSMWKGLATMDEHAHKVEKHKAIIRRLFEEALRQEKLELIETLFSSDFIDHSTPEQAPGYAGVKEYFLELRRGFPDLQVVLEDIIAESDRVVVRTSWHGTHLGVYEGVAPTGRKVTRTLIQIFRIADGLIAEEWNEGPGLLHTIF